ncbi:hypothetical protein ONE63_005622 [Megalurothrips usitatus]|uniref:Homeobox domain-containing protein n=1 Tax=Megalurothrips usitatus TaxID=439358 RepID=A0AAV7XW51_9NEOP|nr:hypothetical protein ONE63_005622 [Megalurothrips usitatus]
MALTFTVAVAPEFGERVGEGGGGGGEGPAGARRAWPPGNEHCRACPVGPAAIRTHSTPLPLTPALALCLLQVWFQNRRAKWKKRKKTTNVFRSPGGLLPSHGLPPFGAMSDGLCPSGIPSGMFGSPDSRWPGVSSMASGLSQLSQSGVPMSSFSQSLGQLNQGSPLGGGLNAGLNIATSMASNGSTVYQAHYGINTLGTWRPLTAAERFIPRDAVCHLPCTSRVADPAVFVGGRGLCAC